MIAPVTAFPVVGIGASAGGLEAFTQLLRALSPDNGMAYVLVQHLAPTHVSALAEILSRATKMPVTEVTDAASIEPNHVYVIPPGSSMTISQGALHLLPREGTGAQRPIDHFFRSLAEDQGYRAIGVVLSGTASDGTAGLETIKSEGGITFAQDDTAQQSGMPHSAIASGCVDFVLPAEGIARELARIAKHPHTAPDGVANGNAERPDLSALLRLLHSRTGVDFSDYKFNTLHRRVTRRMLLQKHDVVAEYARALHKDPAEADALYRDILIGVTRFFREPAAFDALKESVFPRLAAERARNDPVRIWTIGCSTGQEAYSLAIAWAEFAEATDCKVRFQVFATDLNDAGVLVGRTGTYPKEIADDVSPERLRRFFVEVDGHYRINKSIRECCVFSRHNVLVDPPFSRIDLISCRNLLIYLERVLQQRVIPTLHYALKQDGHLWLGHSETIGGFRHLFETRDAKHRIYAKRAGSVSKPGHFPLHHGAIPRPEVVPFTSRSREGTDLNREADRLLVSRFAPPSVLISNELEIVRYRGDTSAYLSPAPGKASLNLLKMLREGLVSGVRAAVLRAGESRAPVREEGLRVRSGDGFRDVAVEVIPLEATGGAEDDGGFLVLFDEPDRSNAPRPAEVPSASTVDDAERSAQELVDTRGYLQAVIEQHEASNEELQSANEEVQSANEELQSINEELETSKEELQSSNEELATVNDELNHRNSDLGRANNDLANLVGSVQTPIIMLGPDLRIRRFTPAAEKLFNLTAGDVGRPLHTVRLGFDIPDLETLVAEVFDAGSAQEREVRDANGRWYSLRLRPYRTLENRIEGVVVLLLDVDLIKRAHEFSRSIVATVTQPLLVLDSTLRVRTANEAYYDSFKVAAEETEGRLLYEIGGGQWDLPKLRTALQDIIARDSEVRDLVVEREFEGIGTKTVVLNARRLLQESDRTASILLSIEDITERERANDRLRRYAEELSANDRHKNEFLAMLAHELRNPLAPIRNSLQILKRARGDERVVNHALQLMDRQASQMSRLVDDLLDVSRISRGTIELRADCVDLVATLSEAIDAARSVCATRNQTLNADLPDAPILLVADPVRLSQVVGNLLHNASKFTGAGGEIRLSAWREGADAVFRVRDNGIGLSAAQAPHVFDMFMQVDTSLERSVSGLGIGLTLAKNLVEAHGGTLAVSSEGIGQGSEFVVRLPALPESVDTTPAVPVPAVAATNPHRILVVDDNRDSADSLASLLEMTGNETHTAFDGEAAVEAASQLRPEVILLDIGLPKLNGYDACARIRAQPWGKGIVIVALTGWGQDGDRLKSREAGFDGHMVKPVDYAALTTLLEELLQRSAAG